MPADDTDRSPMLNATAENPMDKSGLKYAP